MMPDTTRSATFQSETNRSLVQRYLTHSDHAAFAQLVERFGPMVFGVSHRLLVDLEDAEDATQLAFTELARRAGTIENLDGLASWLHVVTAHIAIRLRKQRRQHRPLAAEPIDSRSSLEDLARRSDFEILTEELEKLPLEWREPLLLRYFSGLSNEAAAQQLGTTVAALEGRLKRGKKSLRVRLLRRGVSVAAILTAIGPASNKTLAATGNSSIGSLDSDYWASVTDASQDLASDPTTLSFLPALESTTMAAPILTFKAAAAIGTAAVVMAMLGGEGHHDRLSNVTSPVSTAVADGSQSSAVQNQSTTVLQFAQADPAKSLSTRPNEPKAQDDERVPKLSNPSQFNSASLLLQKQASLNQAPKTLMDVLDHFSKSHDLSILVHSDALDTLGVDTDAEVILPIGPTTVHNALIGILASVDPRLSYVINDDQVVEIIAAGPVDRNRRKANGVTAITAVLENDPFKLKIVDTPLSDGMKLIAEQYDIPISIDENALADIGMSVDDQFTMTENFPTLGQALTEILSNKLAGLDFVIRGHRLIVTSAEAAAASTSTRRYDVPVGLEPNELVESLSQHVTHTARGPVDWETTGGGGVVSVLSLGNRQPVLLVTQSDRGHEAVKEFMNLLVDPSPSLPGTAPTSKRLRSDIPPVLSAGPGLAKTQPTDPAFTTPLNVADEGIGPKTPRRDESLQSRPTADLSTNVSSIVAYDIAKLSRLIFTPKRKTSYEDYGSDFEAGGGYGGPAPGEYGGMDMGGYGPPPPIRLVTLDDLRQLSKLSIEAELTVQRGSQLLIRTDAENHALIRKAITELTELFEEAGPPEIEGQTTIRAESDNGSGYDDGDFGGGYGEGSYDDGSYGGR